ncbi:MAG: SagB/ThcOx family dehydrogenase [Polyangiaceae bacterium]
MTSPFRFRSPETWRFHEHTSRWTFNTVAKSEEGIPVPSREDPLAPFLRLPEPAHDPALEALLQRRFSCRHYAKDAVSIEGLSSVLHRAYGVLGSSRMGDMEMLERPVPSGGGMYPLELYVIALNVTALNNGIYHYVPIGSGLELRCEVTVPSALLTYLFMGQPLVAQAAFVCVITAEFSRLMRKYGDRGYRYVLFEAGHVAQNVNLAAASLGLGSCNLGGFFDRELGQLLELDLEEEFPLYGIAVGVPPNLERTELRHVVE